jgi:hypothetical protein
LATIQLPHGIKSLTSQAQKLFAGSVDGSIYIICMDQYSIYQMLQQGVAISYTASSSSDLTIEQQVFGHQ